MLSLSAFKLGSPLVRLLFRVSRKKRNWLPDLYRFGSQSQKDVSEISFVQKFAKSSIMRSSLCQAKQKINLCTCGRYIGLNEE